MKYLRASLSVLTMTGCWAPSSKCRHSVKALMIASNSWSGVE
jgi:hypothetical protein